jgi:hypothetical protein
MEFRVMRDLRTNLKRRLIPMSLLACALIVGATTAPSQGQPTAHQAQAAPAPAAEPATNVGGTVFEVGGESTREAFDRVRQTYGGKLGAVRVFAPGMPASWTKLNNNYPNTPLVVSFKGQPADVVAGRHDAELRAWFAAAPRDRVTRWAYWHEPEDNFMSAGEKEQYRRAWQRISGLADSANNPNLRATLILMCWTLKPKSGRDWRDYYAGAGAIDGFGFDCYNAGHRKGVYRPVDRMLESAVALSASTGKPWGIAELGSIIVSSDRDGRGRAAWLRAVVTYAEAHQAAFVTYFDSDVGTDYRLHDTPSKQAWRELVSGQFN